MRHPKAILFDLCDTLFLFEPDRLPVIQIDGQQIRSTTGLVHENLGAMDLPALDLFYQAFAETTQQITAEREQTCREITSEEKFRRVFRRLDRDPGQLSRQALMRAVHTHMNALASALHLPSSHRRLAEALTKRYTLGIITNFDHSPTVHGLLQREGLDPYFKPIIISADIGWRKPHKEIFQKALDLLHLKGEETIFVGNDLKADIGGAHAAGIPAIWFNRHNQTPTPGFPVPDHTLLNLGDLQTLVYG
jgi:putative hydrolase of the HAD superfamily